MSVAVNAPAALGADELAALRDAVRDACRRHAGPDEARRLLDGTPDTAPENALHRALFAELGIGGLVVPERFGGADAGWAALHVVLAELGRALACVPFVPSAVLATQLLLASGDEAACASLLPGIADGSVVATVAVVERGGSWDEWTLGAAPSGATIAQPDGDGWRLTGGKSVVPFGATVDLLLVLADTGDGAAIFAVDRSAPGLTVTALATLDGTRPVADLRLANTPGRLVGAPGGGADAVRRTLDFGGLATAAEDAGAARRCLELSVEYALLRTQFDRVIGSFQAMKHKLADMLVRVELAEAAVEDACLAADTAVDGAAVAAVVAHACAAESFRFVAAETIQTHGGIGFTWEHPAHLYFRRAKTSELLYGGARRYRQRLLDRLGLGPS